jgi:hypothetical protein
MIGALMVQLYLDHLGKIESFCSNQMPKEKPGGDEKKLLAACSTEENPRLKYC